MRSVTRFAWSRMVVSIQSLPEGPGTPSPFSRRGIARGLALSEKSRNTLRTIPASVSLIVRPPRTGPPELSNDFTTC